MTVTKAITITCLCFLLLPQIRGQQTDPSVVTQQMPELQQVKADSSKLKAAGDVLEIPNVFTPNGDQVNDFFEVDTDGTTVYEFSIFTRTGTRIYHSQSPRIFWDGNSLDGKELKEGIYYYVIEEHGGSNPYDKAGFMYLFR